MSCVTCGGFEDTIAPCACGYRIHPKCLARRQFTHAGQPGEKSCEECGAAFPTWQDNIMSRQYDLEDMATLEVSHNNRRVKVMAINGVEGRDAFRKQCQRLFKFTRSPELVMRCVVPGTNETRTFRGWETFDVAIFCASVAEQKGVNLMKEIVLA